MLASKDWRQTVQIYKDLLELDERRKRTDFTHITITGTFRKTTKYDTIQYNLYRKTVLNNLLSCQRCSYLKLYWDSTILYHYQMYLSHKSIFIFAKYSCLLSSWVVLASKDWRQTVQIYKDLLDLNERIWRTDNTQKFITGTFRKTTKYDTIQYNLYRKTILISLLSCQTCSYMKLYIIIRCT